MTIYVHIDRLVLDGLPAPRAPRRTLGSALETELGRLLTAEGVGARLATGGSLAHLRAGDLRLGTTGGAAGLGTQIAAAVHAGLRR